MRLKHIVILLAIAGILGILGGLWSGADLGPGPVRMGEGGLSEASRNTAMVLSVIGGIGALVLCFIVKLLSRTILGVAALVFAALMIPSVFLANVLAMLSLFLIAFSGVLLLAQPPRPKQTIGGAGQ